jgi:serine O-acetyltransferase
MIRNYQDYVYYLEADRVALNKPRLTSLIYLKEILTKDYIWKFQRLLRKCEYYRNVKAKESVLCYVIYYGLKWRFRTLSLKLGFLIPENVFGPGLAIVHYGNIVINPKVKVGSNCRIHVGVNIGESGGEVGAPIIGNNVYIAPGAKIYGNIHIADNCAVGANSAVGKSFDVPGMLIGGIPASNIKAIDIKKIIKHI